ncbi:dTMP kinase [Parasutterella muris]|uniref:Thymidylate kinase n=1 Tax=Parasutterella muris TaxID=2565572 RepID=A0A6L6YJQ2_9BURK|nr:dTMP kinase [Parasutterella muris]MVX56908.1 dTMP kinase [Parasutterella muris]
MLEKGKLITVEGVDGAGKSTQMAVIDQALRERGIDLVRTREPGGPETAEKIRKLLLNEPMSPKCELMLMFAAREENLDKIIRPALAKGQWVLCDRFTDASYAYQGYGRGRSIEEIRALENFVHPDLKPDLTVLFDVPTEVAAARLSRKLDRFEKESQDFHRRVREGYLRMAKAEPERFYVVDGTQTPEQISAQLREVFAQWK